MKKILEWQKEIIKRIKELKDKDLLYETIDSAGGDDYEGEFTDRGQYKFDELKRELNKRLPKNFKGFDK
jgi:hypothetical protein